MDATISMFKVNDKHLLTDVLSAALLNGTGETGISPMVPALPTGVDCKNNCLPVKVKKISASVICHTFTL